MPSTFLIVPKLASDYPEFTFAAGNNDQWQPHTKTIFYASDDPAIILHELAHAILGHDAYFRDLDLIAIERDAWAHAKEHLAPGYDISITDDTIDASLDSYRDWIHARSICPSCGATGIQTGEKTYKCLACHTTWRVNEARLCALRRYTVRPN